jgi:predicted nucleotidyltransferase
MLRPYEPQRIILHGSLARGDWNRASDIDLIIIKDTELPFPKRISDVIGLCRTSLSVEPLVYTPEELTSMLANGNSFLEKALHEGKKLYELFDEFDAKEALDAAGAVVSLVQSEGMFPTLGEDSDVADDDQRVDGTT